MDLRYGTNPDDYRRWSTEQLRDNYVVDGLFTQGALTACYTHHDRLLIAGAVPTNAPIELAAPELTGTDFFLERREVGIFNIGGPAVINAGGDTYEVERLHGLYLGMGTRDVTFTSADPANPARLYLVSTSAHRAIDAQPFSQADGEALELGSAQESNRRTLTKLIHKDGIASCQLMLGFTQLHDGSMWNTMPAHLHDRRTEIYLYFDLDNDARVFHLMGVPEETRHLVMANEQAVISPGWSIHAGFGTQSYSFIWAMGGETYEFDDMAPVPPTAMR